MEGKRAEREERITDKKGVLRAGSRAVIAMVAAT